VEGGRNQDAEQAAKLQRRLARHHQDHFSGAASCVGERASSSCESARTSPMDSEPSDLAEGRYVQAVLDCYRSIPGTPGKTSRHDRKCAQALFRRGVPLDLVQGAMVVAVARRTFRKGDPLPRIRALHFFLPVTEEMLEVPCDSGYVQYLKTKLEALAGHEIHFHRDEAYQPESTCRIDRGSSPPLREASSSRGR
jgi:hypothetical protein